MILSAHTLRTLKPVSPFVERSELNRHGLTFTYGLGPAGYDVRVEFDREGKRESELLEAGGFMLVSTIEYFTMPPDIIGIVHDKSSWARRGVCVQNTVIAPGWCGYLTLELSNHSRQAISIWRGDPIAQIIFQKLDLCAESYQGKYQNQQRGPQGAL